MHKFTICLYGISRLGFQSNLTLLLIHTGHSTFNHNIMEKNYNMAEVHVNVYHHYTAMDEFWW